MGDIDMVRRSDADRRDALARELERIERRRTHERWHGRARPRPILPGPTLRTRHARTSIQRATTRLFSTDGDPRPAAHLIHRRQPMSGDEWRALERRITIHYVANVVCETLEALFPDITDDTN